MTPSLIVSRKFHTGMAAFPGLSVISRVLETFTITSQFQGIQESLNLLAFESHCFAMDICI